jgi:F0F1-type ATP synthase membrane subunit c/vacuolar-type H+-ATPase subunit K
MDVADPRSYFLEILFRVPSDAWDLADINISSLLWGLLIWAISYGVAKQRKRSDQMERMKFAAWRFIEATVMAGVIVLFLLLFVISPFQHYKELTEKHTVAKKESEKVPVLNAETVQITQQLNDANAARTELKNQVSLLQDKLGEAQKKLSGAIKAREDAKVAIPATVPYLQIEPPRVLKKGVKTLVSIPFRNTGPVQANLTSVESYIYLGGKLHCHDKNVKDPVTMAPTRSLKLDVLVPENTLADLNEGKTELHIDLEMKYAGIAGDQHTLCYRGTYDKDRAEFSGLTNLDRPCNFVPR